MVVVAAPAVTVLVAIVVAILVATDDTTLAVSVVATAGVAESMISSSSSSSSSSASAARASGIGTALNNGREIESCRGKHIPKQQVPSTFMDFTLFRGRNVEGEIATAAGLPRNPGDESGERLDVSREKLSSKLVAFTTSLSMELSFVPSGSKENTRFSENFLEYSTATVMLLDVAGIMLPIETNKYSDCIFIPLSSILLFKREYSLYVKDIWSVIHTAAPFCSICCEDVDAVGRLTCAIALCSLWNNSEALHDP